MSSLLNFYNNFSHWITAFWNLTALMTETWNQRFSTKYLTNYPVNIYLFKFNNTNTRKECEISSELITETLEIGSKYCSGVLMVNFNEFHTFFHCFCCCLSMYMFAEGNLFMKRKSSGVLHNEPKTASWSSY